MVDSEASIKQYCEVLRDVGRQLILEAAGTFFRLDHRTPWDSQLVSSSGEPPTQFELDRLQQTIQNDLVILDIEQHFESRYAHWRAEALALVGTREGQSSPQLRLNLQTQKKRLRSTVESWAAVRLIEKHLETKGIGANVFARNVGTTERTLRKFRNTGRIRRDLFDEIAKELGMDKEALLSAE